jgi:uncharacterized protein YecE (DUF72 family)
MAQLDLFGRPGTPRVRSGIGPAPQPDDVVDVGRRLPAGVRLGTSSWSFPGWGSLVWDRPATRAALARAGLAAYAAHPCFRAVGLDRTFYSPLTRAGFAALAAQAPPGFRFVMKALETTTLAAFPRHPRYGEHAGQPNPRFLDAAGVRDDLLRPAVAGLGDKIGPVVFQFPPQPPDRLGGPARFAMRLRAFVRELPAGPPYAFELRNPELLDGHVERALADTGAVPCFTVHPAMPPVDVQAAALSGACDGPFVVRWMLGGGRDYEEARARYAPFDRIVDPDPATRTAIATLVQGALAAGRRAFVIVNNKAEGSAPASVVLLARELVAG